MNAKRLWRIGVLAIAMVLGKVPFVSAALIVSNLGESTDSSFPVNDVDVGGGLRIGMEVAQSFTAGAAVDFASATLSLGTGVGGGTFSVQLWSDVSGSPGSSLVTLVGNPNPVSAGLYTYTATTPFALSASATYWVVALVSHTAPDKIYSWNATASTTETGDAGWSLGDKAMSRFVLGGSPDAWGSESFAAQMGITIVPETATLRPLVVFLGFGLGLRFAAKRMSFGRANEQITAVSRRWNPIRVVG